MLLAGSIIFPLAYFTLKDGNQKQSPSRNINSFFRDPTVAAAAPQNTTKQQQPNGKTSGSSFNSFLRTAPASAKRDATNFSAFLKGIAGQQLSSTGPGQGDSAVKVGTLVCASGSDKEHLGSSSLSMLHFPNPLDTHMHHSLCLPVSLWLPYLVCQQVALRLLQPMQSA